MKLIDRYILKQIIIGFLLVLTSMTVLVWLTQSLRMIDMIVTKGVSVKMFLELTVLVLPNFLQVLFPLALFAVTLFTLIRMQSDKELMVMQAVGMSAAQIMRPVFLLAGILTIISFLFSVYVIPASNRELREMKWQIKNDLSHLLLQEGQFNSFKNGLTLYVRERESNGHVKGVLAYESKKPNQTTILSADNGTVFQEPEGIRVEFHDGVRQEYRADTHQFSILKFEKYTMNFADKGPDSSRATDVRELSLGELWQAKKRDFSHKPLWRKHKVELVKRLIQPLYNLTFMFLIIFGVLSGFYSRRGQMGRVNVTVLAALVIQSLALAFENMAGKNLWFLSLVVLNVFTPLLFVYHIRIKKRLRKKGKFLSVFFVVLGLVSSSSATNIKLPKINSDAEVDFEADSVSFNQKKNEMEASGHVVLTQENLKVETDRITFNQTENQITAPELVKMTLSDGTVATAEHGKMSGKLDAIEMGKTEIVLYEGSRFGAESMERQPDGDSYLTEATYTPCDVCEGEAPLWRMRSKTVWHDSTNQDIVYKNMFLDVKNVPVAYMPYWRMPDFSVKRRSGFLAPGFSSTREIRHAVSLPYFVNVADNQNLTLTPIIAVDHFPMGLLDYKGVFSESALNVQASGTKDRGESRKQGHVRADMQYDINNNWKLSGQFYRVATDTYFRRYRIPDVDDTEPFLRSHLTVERYGNRNYFRLKGHSFQSLQEGVSSHSIPVVLPVLDYKYNTAPITNFGLYGFTAVNAAMFNTRDRFKSNRLSVTQGVQLPYVSPIGVAVDLKGYVRGDGYAVNTGKYAFAGRETDETYDTGRLYANASATIRYPFVAGGEETTQILEPIAMVVTAPNGGNPDKIPNVDSLVFDFDDTDLFSDNRFSGYDRVEPGSRINYGLKWSRFNHKTKRSITALVGQSYQFNNNEMMQELMGYENNFSDYVGRIQVSIPYIDFLYRTRINRENFKPKKNEVGVGVGSAPLRLGVSYVMRKAYTIGDNTYDSREEIVYTGSSQLTRNWSLSGYYRYDLSGKGEPIKAGGALQYDNECTTLIFEGDKSYTQDRDYKGSFSFMVRVVLKTLGGI